MHAGPAYVFGTAIATEADVFDGYAALVAVVALASTAPTITRDPVDDYAHASRDDARLLCRLFGDHVRMLTLDLFL